MIGVSEDTVINWELRGMRPRRRDIRKKVKLCFHSTQTAFIISKRFSIG